eukprot:1667390-Lingulodinium_polyedra.AAC.1
MPGFATAWHGSTAHGSPTAVASRATAVGFATGVARVVAVDVAAGAAPHPGPWHPVCGGNG